MNFFVLLAFGFVFYAENFPSDVATIKLSVCQYPEMVLFLTWRKSGVRGCYAKGGFLPLPALPLADADSACVVEL